MTADRRTAAERQRLARARRKACELVAPVIVSVDLTEELIALGLLRAVDDEDREAIGRALGEFIRTHLDRVTRDAG